MSDPGPGAVARFFSLLLMSAGLLISILSGCCSLYFLVAGALSVKGAELLPWILLVGGIPILLGVILFNIGRSIGK